METFLLALSVGFSAATATDSFGCDRRIVNHHACYWQTESEILNRHPTLWSRQGATLNIRLHSGATLSLTDRIDDHSPGSNTRFLADQVFHSTDYLGLMLRYYEGGGYMLVSLKTGKTTNVQGQPRPSPDGARFAVFSDGIDAEHDESLLAIYRQDTDVLVKEYLISPNAWGIVDVRWRDGTKLEFLQRHDFRNIPDGEQEFQWRTLNCTSEKDGVCLMWTMKSAGETQAKR